MDAWGAALPHNTGTQGTVALIPSHSQSSLPLRLPTAALGFRWHGMTGGWVERAGGSAPSMSTGVLQGPGAASMSQNLPFP